MLDQQKATVEEFVVAAFERNDRTKVRQLLAPEFVDHDPKIPGKEVGPNGFERHVLDVLHGAFPDLSVTIEALVAEGSDVVCRYTMTGTHKGSLRGIDPSGNSISVTGMAQLRLDGGEVTELWINADSLGLLEQIDALNHDHDG